jgi:hypothetical protein
MSDSESPGESRRGASGRAGNDGGPVSFDHHHVTPTPRASQKRLFASRHRHAKKERRSERRRKRMLAVFVPLIVAGMVFVVGVSLRNMYLADKVAEEKLAREAEAREKREEVEERRGPVADNVEEARKRFLKGEAPSSGEIGGVRKQ